MTREEAIDILKCDISADKQGIEYCHDEVGIEALDMAIKALEQEPSVEFVKTEESNDNDTKYLNINVSDSEVKRNPDIVRLCSDVGILEYAKPKISHWVDCGTYIECFKCGCLAPSTEFADGVLFKKSNFCPDCGAKMVESQESEDKE